MTTKIGKTGFWLVAILATALSWASAARAQVEIEYWQYTFAQRVQAIDTLIKQFEAANPGIKVKHTHIPYDDFRVKIAAAIPAGQGPDVVQLFYGWLQDYLKAGLLQPLPADAFSVVEVEREYFPIVQQMKIDGKTTRCRPRSGRWRSSGTRPCSRKPDSTPSGRPPRWTSSSTTPGN